MAAKRKAPITRLERTRQWRASHREQVNASELARKASLAEAGKCVQCKRKNSDPTRKRCPKCAKAARLAAQASRDARRLSQSNLV